MSRVSVWTKRHIKKNGELLTASIGEVFVRATFLKFVTFIIPKTYIIC